jgi:hypothetical protein
MNISLLPGVNPAFAATVLEPSAAWRFPAYARAFFRRNTDTGEHSSPPLLTGHWFSQALKPLLPAAFVEWRYFSIISPAFHGIVGLALFNPFSRFEQIAESGLLFILAGAFDMPPTAAALREQATNGQLRQICWMHLFPTASLSLVGPGDTTLRALHNGVQLDVGQLAPNHGTVHLSSESGLALSLNHTGLDGTAIEPCFADDLRRVAGAHWIVYNPSPIARTSGEIAMTRQFVRDLVPQQQDRWPSHASAALAGDPAAGSIDVRWHNANGYYEHSFGLNPLLLHGWDFLFVPNAERRQGLVLQTYLRSKVLRYIEVFWNEEGVQRYTRFTAEQMRLEWHAPATDPEIGVVLPGKRTLSAHKPGLRLEVENTLPHQIPFLRPEKLAVRHFFISEQIGFCSWRLTDDSGRVLAEEHEQPAGGEIAHLRLNVPGYPGYPNR